MKSSQSRVFSATRGPLVSTLLASALANVPAPVVDAVLSVSPKTSPSRPASQPPALDEPPPPLEEVDPVLAEHFRLVANGQHSAIKTIVHEEENIHLKKHDGTWLHRRVRPVKLPGRNEPCFCGSGKKFKKCCLR